MKIVLDLLHNSTRFFLDNTNKVMFHYRIDLKQQCPHNFPALREELVPFYGNPYQGLRKVKRLSLD